MAMKSVQLRNGSYIVREGPRIVSLPDGMIRLDVHAVPLGEFDVGIMYGLSRFAKKSRLDEGLGSGFVGVVTETTKGSKFLLGEFVFGFAANPMKDSTLVSEITVLESVCTRCPGRLTPTESASLIVDLMIAERTLRLCKTTDVDSILITGGTTPMARAIIEVAKSSMFGVEWVATTVACLSDREYAESIGADETFDSSCNGGDWSRAFVSGANRKEYDIVIDVVGDSKHAKQLVKPLTGRLVSLLNKETPEEVLNFDERVGNSFLSSLNRRLLGSRLVGDFLTGCSGRRRKCKGSEYLTVIPTGDGEILERLCVLIDTEAITGNVEECISLSQVDEYVSRIKKLPFTMRGRIVVDLSISP